MIVTSAVLLTISAIRVYDLVVVMTGGGPGIATEMPAKYVMDMLFLKSNLGQATAAATLLRVDHCGMWDSERGNIVKAITAEIRPPREPVSSAWAAM